MQNKFCPLRNALITLRVLIRITGCHTVSQNSPLSQNPTVSPNPTVSRNPTLLTPMYRPFAGSGALQSYSGQFPAVGTIQGTSKWHAGANGPHPGRQNPVELRLWRAYAGIVATGIHRTMDQSSYNGKQVWPVVAESRGMGPSPGGYNFFETSFWLHTCYFHRSACDYTQCLLHLQWHFWPHR